MTHSSAVMFQTTKKIIDDRMSNEKCSSVPKLLRCLLSTRSFRSLLLHKKSAKKIDGHEAEINLHISEMVVGKKKWRFAGA